MSGVCDTLLLQRFISNFTRRKLFNAANASVAGNEESKKEKENVVPTSIAFSSTSKTDLNANEDEKAGEEVMSEIHSGLDLGKRWWHDGYATWNEEDFKKNMRMTRQSFEYILEEMRPFIEKQQNVDKISSDRQLALTIYRLAHGCCFPTLQSLFGVPASYADVIFSQVCCMLVREMYDQFIRLPATAAEWTQELHGFINEYDFPCIGAWEGFQVTFNIKLKSLNGVHRTCTTNHLGLVGYDRRFLNIVLGDSDSDQESMLLRTNSIYEKDSVKEVIENKSCGNSEYKSVPTLTFKDNMFLKVPWLTKGPNTDANTLQRCNFNRKLVGAKAVTVDAYGTLKGRWRILFNKTSCHFKNLKDIIKACVLLHNMCIERGDACERRWKLEDEEIATMSKRIEAIEDEDHPSKQSCMKIAIRL